MYMLSGHRCLVISGTLGLSYASKSMWVDELADSPARKEANAHHVTSIHMPRGNNKGSESSACQVAK